MTHRNRDWAAKPYQGNGRSGSEYGNTHLGKPHKTWLCEYGEGTQPGLIARWSGPVLIGLAAAALIVAGFPAVGA